MTTPKTAAWPTAGDIMQTKVVTVAASAPLSDVERLLSEHRISGAPVTDAAGHIVGVISIRDLIDRYTQDPDTRPRRGRGFYELSADEMDEEIESLEVPAESEETAGDLMTAQVHSVPRAASLAEVARRMVELQVHRVLVIDHKQHVGLIGTFDVLRAVAALGAPATERRPRPQA